MQHFDDKSETMVKLCFLEEQFQLACCEEKTARRYSPQMMVHAFMIRMLSPACYDGLRSNFYRLIQLTQSFGASVEDIRNNKHFLKVKSQTLQEREKFVVMQIDEIYVKQKIDYKNGKIYGYAENSINIDAARTIYAVFASSAFSNFKEVVALKPVNKVTSEELAKIVKEAAALLAECNLKVIIIVSDNNAVNRKLFKILCGSGILFLCNFQVFEGLKTFCTFDSVHAGKSFRNNWLNQKDSDKTFVYSDFNNFQILRFAKFSVLKEIFKKEKNLLIKTAPKLNYKNVYPSNIER